MTTAALVNVSIPSLAMAEDELVRVLEASVYPGAKLESIKLVIGYCKGQNLDPLLKPVHIVPMSVKKAGTKDQYEWRDVIMPGIGLYRIHAARTDEYAGCTEPEFGPMQDLKVGEFSMKYPEWCKIAVSRLVQGHIVTFPAKEYWLENYATAGRDSTVPNAMWKKRPIGQLAKCAEAQALRKAFPEVGAQPTAEELEGKDLDVVTIDGTTGALVPQIEQPQSKTKTPQPPEQPKQEDKPDTESKYKGAPATDGMKRTVRAALTNAALSEVDMKARFGFGLDDMPRDAVNDVMAFTKDPVPAK